MSDRDRQNQDLARTQLELVELVRIELLLEPRLVLSRLDTDRPERLQALQTATAILNDLDPLRARFSLGSYCG